MRKQQVIALALAAASTASLVTGCGGEKEEGPGRKRTAGSNTGSRS